MHGRLRARPGAVVARRRSRPTSTASSWRPTGRASSRSWRAPIRRVPAIADAGVNRIINGPEALHPGQRVHPRRVRGPRLLRGRRVLGPRDRRGRRDRPPGGDLDRRRRARARPLEDGHPAVRAGLPQPGLHAGPLDRELRDLLRHPLPERGAPGRAGPLRIVADLPAAGRARRRRSARSPAGSARTGSSRTPPAGDEALRPRGWAGRALVAGDRRRGARDAHGGRPVRRDVVRQDRDRRAGCRRLPRSGCAPTTSTAGRPDRLHAAAQPARRHRVRPDRHPGHGRPLPARHRDRVRPARPGLAAAAPARRRERAAQRPHVGPGLLRAVGAAGARHPRRRSRATTSRTPASRTSPRGPSPSASVPVYALRVTYVGELGWELYAHTEFGRRALADAVGGRAGRTGMVAGGYRAIDALRLEKGYRVWSSDITPDETPFEAGLGFAVALDKGVDFIGREALVAAKAAGPRKRLRCLVLDDPRSVCLGNEPVRIGGDVVGRVTSGGYGFAVERSIAYAYLPPDARPSGRAARSRCSASGSASRSRASRCTTRPASGSGRERATSGATASARRRGADASSRLARRRPGRLRRGRRARARALPARPRRSRPSPTGRS